MNGCRRAGGRLASFTLLWAAVWLTACGGGSDDEANGERAGAKPGARYVIPYDSSDVPVDSSDLRLIREVLSDVQADFGGGLPGAVCPELTEAGQRELENAPGGVAGDCTATGVKLRERNAARGVPPRYSKVLSVKVHGRIATALVMDPNDPGKPKYRVPFLNEGVAGWALPSLTYAEPVEDLLRSTGAD